MQRKAHFQNLTAVYIYTPTIPETDENGNHYILSEEAILPEIYVMVDCVDNGIVLYSSNIVASGTCGANLTWILDDEGVLTISGTGAMANWNKKGSPWYANEDKIEFSTDIKNIENIIKVRRIRIFSFR